MGFGAKYIENEFLNIARGTVRGASSIHKFGAVPAMSQNATGTVWDVNDTLYPWTAFDTAGVLTIPAVNASDGGGDTGFTVSMSSVVKRTWDNYTKE